MQPPKTLVLLPALNEADNIAAVVNGIRATLPNADVLVINDGSSDATGTVAAQAGAFVLHMPHNVGIGASVQTGFRFAQLNGYTLVARTDADGQHAADELPRLIARMSEQQADMVIGSRYIEDRGYSGTAARRFGSWILASLISTITRQRFTDPTSGFFVCNQRAIALCARWYPHDYPEPEAIVMLYRAGLRLQEIPVTMHPRQGGQSSITAFRSAYYMLKVTLAILITLLRPAVKAV